MLATDLILSKVSFLSEFENPNKITFNDFYKLHNNNIKIRHILELTFIRNFRRVLIHLVVTLLDLT